MDNGQTIDLLELWSFSASLEPGSGAMKYKSLARLHKSEVIQEYLWCHYSK